MGKPVSNNVVHLDADTACDIDPLAVLSGLMNADPVEVLTISYMEDGKLSVRSSHSDIGQLLLMMELAKTRLMASAEAALEADAGPSAPILPFPGNSA